MTTISEQIVKLSNEQRRAEYWRDNDHDPEGVARANEFIEKLKAELNRLLEPVLEAKP